MGYTLKQWQQMTPAERSAITASKTGSQKVIGIIAIATVLFLGFFFLRGCYHVFNPPARQLSKYEFLNKRAHEYIYETEELVKRNINHPLTADFSYTNMQILVIDTDKNLVAITGTGTAKNSFGVPDEFHYRVSYLVDSTTATPIDVIVK